MSDPSNSLRLEVVSVLRNGRRRYDPVSKQRLVEACRQPGASLAGLALRHGVNANLLRKWVTGRPGQQRAGTAVSASERTTEVFVPVVELCGMAVAGTASSAFGPAPCAAGEGRAQRGFPWTKVDGGDAERRHATA